jgi:Ca2+:H+ antiporter
MKLLLQEIRRNPLLWLLVFVPVALAAEKLNHEAHTLHFILSVLAILPLAVLLSHATESVAAKTGDSVGGLLNATLGNLPALKLCRCPRSVVATLATLFCMSEVQFPAFLISLS